MNSVNVCASTKKPDSWVPRRKAGAHTPESSSLVFFALLAFFARMAKMNSVNVSPMLTKEPDALVLLPKRQGVGEHTGESSRQVFSFPATAIDATDNRPAWARCDGNTGTLPSQRDKASQRVCVRLHNRSSRRQDGRDETHHQVEPGRNSWGWAEVLSRPWITAHY